MVRSQGLLLQVGLFGCHGGLVDLVWRCGGVTRFVKKCKDSFYIGGVPHFQEEVSFCDACEEIMVRETDMMGGIAKRPDSVGHDYEMCEKPSLRTNAGLMTQLGQIRTVRR